MTTSNYFFVRMFLLLICGSTTLVYGQDCSDLPPPSNGMVAYDRNGSQPWPVGTVATLSCNSGYFFVENSGDPKRTCQGGDNNQWSGSSASCGVPCPVFPMMSGGFVGYNNDGVPPGFPGSRSTGVMSTISCNNGYTLNGSRTGTCQSNGTWSNGETTCQRICSDLSDVPTNGQPVTYSAGTSGSRPVNTVATYSCNSGYTLVGFNSRRCWSDGTWNGSAPTCPDCPTPSPLANGNIMFSSGSSTVRPIGTVITYNCNTNYMLVGSTSVTCQPDASWSGSAPTCQRICPDLPSISNGTITYNSGPPRIEGAVATYNCTDGFLFAVSVSNGAVRRTCRANGQWSLAPPVCDVPCPALTVTNGVVQYKTTSGTVVSIDTGLVQVNLKAVINCNHGYTPFGSSMRIYQSGGVWSGSETTCQVPCPTFLVTNGDVSYSGGQTVVGEGWSTGTKATLTCNQGFTIVGGNSSRICQLNGLWSGSSPTCQMTCPDLTPPANGRPVEYSDSTSPRANGSTATYSCDTGYVVVTGDSVRICTSSGWNGIDPVCTATCSDLTLTNGMISYSTHTIPRLEGTVASHTCDVGYVLSGGSERTCQSDRTWSGRNITCIASCSNITLDNGMVVYSRNGFPILAGVVAIHRCSDGYLLSGDLNRTCTSTPSGGGVWGGSTAVCTAICDDLPNITNADITYSPTSSPKLMNSVASYTCHLGLMLMGSAQRTCQVDRSWSGTEPFCQRQYLYHVLTVSITCFCSTGVFLQLRDDSLVTSDSDLLISRVGVGKGGLLCKTDHSQCCRTFTDAHWFSPNNTVVSSTPGVGDFYVTRGDGYITLNHYSNGTAAAGQYCCVVPVRGNTTQRFCAVLILAATEVLQSGGPGAVIGGALGGSAVVIILAVTIVLVVLVLRRSRQKAYKPKPYLTVYTKKNSDQEDEAATVKKYEEPTISGFPSETRAVEGEEVCLRVNVGGHPPPTLTWYHGGKEVTPDYATELNNDGTLAHLPQCGDQTCRCVPGGGQRTVR